MSDLAPTVPSQSLPEVTSAAFKLVDAANSAATEVGGPVQPVFEGSFAFWVLLQKYLEDRGYSRFRAEANRDERQLEHGVEQMTVYLERGITLTDEQVWAAMKSRLPLTLARIFRRQHRIEAHVGISMSRHFLPGGSSAHQRVHQGAHLAVPVDLLFHDAFLEQILEHPPSHGASLPVYISRSWRPDGSRANPSLHILTPPLLILTSLLRFKANPLDVRPLYDIKLLLLLALDVENGNHAPPQAHPDHRTAASLSFSSWREVAAQCRLNELEALRDYVDTLKTDNGGVTRFIGWEVAENPPLQRRTMQELYGEWSRALKRLHECLATAVSSQNTGFDLVDFGEHSLGQSQRRKSRRNRTWSSLSDEQRERGW
ncbi:hypothetical protein JCM8547_000267 [Rhodosporidiobolus lusitaniae]